MAAHIFFTVNGWTRSFLMKKEAATHAALSLLAQWDGVPYVMVMDDAKSRVQGEFNKKLREC
jgi:hypothetical protein